MAITFWNTLAVQDLERSRAFYTALGYAVQDMPMPGGITVAPDGSSLICLFNRENFAAMIPGAICDTARAHELIQSVSADSKEAVDELLAKAKQAGAPSVDEAKDQPWGYGGGFSDPDGHLWSVLWLAGGGA